MTVLETIQKCTVFLEKKGVESARLQSELLLAHVLKVPRLKLYLNFELKVSEPDLTSVRELVMRRGNREPLQHLLGTVSFCGLEIQSDRRALIPRPETELLAEMAVKQLDKTEIPSPRVLDFGTGTGCLAVYVAAKCPKALVVALDVSPEALALAQANVAAHQLTSRVELLLGDGFDALPMEKRFDLVISNPPYIPTSEIVTLQPEVRDFDPHLALDGGADGLNFYRLLASKSSVFLNPGAVLMMEIGEGQATSVAGCFTDHGFIIQSVVSDYSARARFVVAQKAAL